MKALHSSLKHFIVQKAQVSNKEAVHLILTGRVLVNGRKGSLLQVLHAEDTVHLDGQQLQSPATFIYLAYYKPRGVESTLNPEIENNLSQALGFDQRVFPVGRLDKDSEGLMLLTNNGKIFDRIIHAGSHQEKEYLVTVDQPLVAEALARLAGGVEIMGRKTRPARVTQVDATTFRIILTQGLNRQIRRMCYKLGYQVQQLVRIRMVSLGLGELRPGEWRHLSPAEIQALTQALAAAPAPGA